MKYIALLGRQPAISIAELERLHPSADVRWFSSQSALLETDDFDFNRLGGSQKAGKVVAEIPHGNWHTISQQIVRHYVDSWKAREGKVTLGISVYGFDALAPRDIQKTGIVLKKKLKDNGVSLRLIPNAEAALNTATSHHNKLGLADNKVELLVFRSDKGSTIISESVGAQNITALARRDQGRPKRDAFVGMLPPKLAQIMINLTGIRNGRLLDPFCGTGVILQEASIMGLSVYGSDISEKMIRYTEDNLNWLQDTMQTNIDWYLQEADATNAHFKPPIDAVATEAYLGQPFSAPPSAAKLTEVRGNCDHIIRGFMKNIAKQLPSGTPLCIAVPAWKAQDGTFTRLPLTRDIETLGFKRVQLSTVNPAELIYHREDQVVARELLVLIKS